MIMMEAIGNNKSKKDIYNPSTERYSWWSISGKPQQDYTFSRAEASFVNLHVIAHIALIWPLMFLGIYTNIFYYDIYKALLGGGFVGGCFSGALLIMCSYMLVASCLNLYLRWQLFKYSENSSITIDVEKHTFSYKDCGKVINFSSSDIEKWYGNIYKFDPYTTNAEIIDIRLKSGENIIVSNGLGHVLDFLLENRKELGLPACGRNSKSLHSYVKEIENSFHSII